MQVTYQQIYVEILTLLGLTESSVDSTVLNSIKLRINQVQAWITYHRAWEWRQKKFYLTTWAPYETGTITITQNDATVTGSSTVWTDKHKMGYLVVNSKHYKIKSITSSTALELMAPMDQDTASGQTYKLVFPDYILNPEISAVTSIRINTQDLVVKKRQDLVYDIANVSSPVECSIGERMWEDFYNTGTASVTNADDSITLSSGTMPDEVVGMPLRVAEFSKLYTIKTKNSGTTLDLEEVYQGDTGSGKTYAIGPKGSQMITFRHSPDDYYFIEIEALVRAPKLIDATEYSMIPDHQALLHGATWLALQDGQKDANPVRIQQARADFERALTQMESNYTAGSNLQWTSADEIYARRSNISTFDPLRSNYSWGY